MSKSPVDPEIAHDLRQPLNVIALVTANLRARLTGALLEPDAAYLGAKLDRIEHQVAKALKMLEAMSTGERPASDN